MEMNVGITAACLTTLKPLAANFFGAVKALTSNAQYASHSSSRSTPMRRSRVSKGYLRQPEAGASESYRLRGMAPVYPSRGTYTSPDWQHRQDCPTSYVTADRRRGSTVKIDAEIWPEVEGIIRTTEVQISKCEK